MSGWTRIKWMAVGHQCSYIISFGFTCFYNFTATTTLSTTFVCSSVMYVGVEQFCNKFVHVNMGRFNETESMKSVLFFFILHYNNSVITRYFMLNWIQSLPWNIWIGWWKVNNHSSHHLHQSEVTFQFSVVNND